MTKSEKVKIAQKVMIAKLNEEIGGWEDPSDNTCYDQYLNEDRPIKSIVASLCKNMIDKNHKPPTLENPITTEKRIEELNGEIENFQNGIIKNPANKINYEDVIREYKHEIKDLKKYLEFIDKIFVKVGERFLSFGEGEIIRLSKLSYEIHNAITKELGQYYYYFIGDWVPARKSVLTITEAEAVNKFINSYAKYSPMFWQKLKNAMQEESTRIARKDKDSPRIYWIQLKTILSSELVDMLSTSSSHDDTSRFKKIADTTVKLITTGSFLPFKAIDLLPPENMSYIEKPSLKDYKSFIPLSTSTKSAFMEAYYKSLK